MLNGITKGIVTIKTIFSFLYLLADLLRIRAVSTVLKWSSSEKEFKFFERMFRIEDVHNLHTIVMFLKSEREKDEE